MSVEPVLQLDVYGPERCETMSVEQARASCRRLAGRRYENFSVLSALVPRDLTDDFAAVYAFCRWADDLGDEIGDRQRALELLGWWRRELGQCYDGGPHHPVFLALRPTIEKHDLPRQPFDDLIRAFEQDQQVTRYETWTQVIEYCRLSANPVGRLVLALLGEDQSEDVLARSDAICTALQLTNHWQDVRRDALQRDRIYIPREMIDIDCFEARLVASAKQGYAVDREFLPATRRLIRALVDKTWPLYEEGEKLLPRLSRRGRPIVWLFSAGGQHVLRGIEGWNYETILHRPRLNRVTKLLLVGQALLRARLGRLGGRES
ncbi:MAG: squalene synthase HpnC [Planctomycetota bacterium]|nr:squalene synthase HpnC [Planctomycetota bacterium]